ncbi:MAG: hypothetical protein A3K60_01455 [Euryarchaeota archaeon RBG_19FT_COMBO_56_21]|nr:MAG: hypothetical protein A3K60_01455 [Euryarchaeota archaeon RBG_19FT_COMBO_56_21]
MVDTRMAYPKHWFVLVTVVLESILTYLFLAALLDPNSILREFWLAICPLIGAVIFMLEVPPIFTAHSLTSTGLRLRMGLLVNEEIPFDAIREVKETSTARGGLRIGIGVKYIPTTRQLFVTSAFSNLISVQLENAVSIGRLRRHRVEEVIINVNFPRGFLDSLEPMINRPGEG